MIKGFKIRIYPTKEQEELMWKHVGACRYIWNYMLALQEERYKNGEKHLSAFDMIKLLTPLKHDGKHDWLNEVSIGSLQTVCCDLDKAYTQCFKHTACKPRFKSRKKTKPSFPVLCDRFYIVNERMLMVPKIGRVCYKTDFNLSIGRCHKFTNPRASYDNGKWFVSFGIECENQAPMLTDKTMGIDLGVKELATVAYGDEQIVYHNINKSKKMRNLERKLKHLQRSISRKYEANKQGKRYVKTNNIVRQEDKLRKVYRRMSNIRNNYIHQTTHELISMLPSKVVMEDLNVIGMLKNKHLSRVISEQCFYEFIRQMQYKCEWNGIEFIQVDRFYPSSQTCSCCGSIKKNLKLSDRTYVCDVCGAKLDRDYNAALNLMRYAA